MMRLLNYLFTLLIKSSRIKRILACIYANMRRIRQEQIYDEYRRIYDIHPLANFNGEDIILNGDGTIIIGEGSLIGRFSFFDVSHGGKIIIGKYCRFSKGVHIFTINTKADQDFSKATEPEQGDVIIGDYSWIGVGVYINQGVTIGHNCIIGANSVVLSDIPDHAMAAGAPAIVKGFRGVDVSQQRT